MVLNTEWSQVEEIELENDGTGLAFGIIGGRSTGVVVKTILPGGVASRDGRLQSGDHILQIGEVQLRGMGSEQAAAVLRQCGVRVKLLVARPIEPTSQDYQALGSHAPIVPTRLLCDSEQLGRHLLELGYSGGLPIMAIPMDHYIIRADENTVLSSSTIIDVVRNPLPVAPPPTVHIGPAHVPGAPPRHVTDRDAAPRSDMLPLDAALRGSDGSAFDEADAVLLATGEDLREFTVTLTKDDLGLGITVAGYVCEKEELSGIFVKSVGEGSSAHLSKQIQVNDRIVEVDGVSLQARSNPQAVQLLRNTGSHVTLKLERYLRGPKLEHLRRALRAQQPLGGSLRPPSPPSPSFSSLPKYSVSIDGYSFLDTETSVAEPETEPIQESAETPTNEDVEIVITGAAEAPPDVPSEPFERELSAELKELKNQWENELDDDDVSIVVANIMKEVNGGLGISLEGTVDVEGGQEVRPHHYIRSVMPGGPVAKSGALQSGDELLEVNGVRLLGLHHLEVVSTLKALPRAVVLVCARRHEAAPPSRVINTAQHREAFAARSILGGSLQTLLPPPDRLVKAKSESSLASYVNSNISIASSNTDGSLAGSRCRSLETVEGVGGVAMWKDTSEKVELVKNDHGLGFSILDYQDPLDSSQTVIVVRSLVTGGVAACDGRLLPGDRLLSVNGLHVGRDPLHRAVQALKAAPKGVVVIEVAKPVQHNGQKSPVVSVSSDDDQTFHEDYQECLDSYGEGLEVVQICLEANDEDASMSNDLSALDDFSEGVNGRRESTLSVIEKLRCQFELKDHEKCVFDNDLLLCGLDHVRHCCQFELKDELRCKFDPKSQLCRIQHKFQYESNEKSEDSDSNRDNVKNYDSNYPKYMTREHSKEISTSDEMVFAVTPTGLERISFEKYWKECDVIDTEDGSNLERIHSDESWKDCRSQICSPNENTPVSDRKAMNISVSNLKFIDNDEEFPQNNENTTSKSEIIPKNSCDIDNIRITSSLINVSQIKNCVNFKSQEILNTSVRKLVLRKEYYNDTEQCLQEYRRLKGLEEKRSNRDSENNQKCIMNTESYIRNVEESFKTEKNTFGSVQNDLAIQRRVEKRWNNDNTQGVVKISENVPNSGASIQELMEIDDTVYEEAKREDLTVLKIDRLSFDVSNSALKEDRSVNRNINKVGDDSKSRNCVNNKVQSIPIVKVDMVAGGDNEMLSSKPDLITTSNQKGINNSVNDSKTSVVNKPVLANTEKRTAVNQKNVMFDLNLKHFDDYNTKLEAEEMYMDSLEMEDVIECHQCFLESLLAQQVNAPDSNEDEHCRFCEALRILLSRRPSTLLERRMSAPAVLDQGGPAVPYDPGPAADKHRRKSTGPLTFCTGGPMTVMKMYLKSGEVSSEGDDMSYDGSGDRRWGPERLVQVFREPSASLGISIVGGKVDLNDSTAIAGIFIKNVVPRSPAGKTEKLQTGDRILEVDGVDVRTVSHNRAVDIIKGSGNPVKLLVQSLIPWNDQQKPLHSPSIKMKRAPAPPNHKVVTPEPVLIQAGIPDEQRQAMQFRRASLKSNPYAKVDPSSVTFAEQNGDAASAGGGENSFAKAGGHTSDSEEGSDEEDERNLEGRMCSAKGQEIDRASAANVKRSPEDEDADKEEEDDFGYTTNKVRKKYGPLGHVVVQVQLERGPAGLGLSLAGHRDRTMMAVFVCGVHPQGAAAKAGQVQVGDEILEVNGVVLHGRCHLNASAIIKGLSGPIFKFILLRRKAALECVAVKPITQFPVSLEEEGDYSGFKNVRTVTIKKGTQSLGIMIIEGKHAEVGQGIFVSDIQEGSAAEVAGLSVGDMILAVNKDTLVGSSYDAAASMLKKTEGIVVLTVCNPNKKESSSNMGDSTLTAGDSSKLTASASKPAISPAKPEPAGDPANVAIAANKETLIEINTDNKSLGVVVVGGKDTSVTTGVVIHEIYPDGPAGKDGRLQPGDQLLEVNSMKFLANEMTQERILVITKQIQPKLRMVVFRPDPIETTKVEVELTKKPGKGLGLCLMARKSGPGVYVSDILNGTPADSDGRIARYDVLVSVNGAKLSASSAEECAAALKATLGKVAITLARAKPTKR